MWSEIYNIDYDQDARSTPWYDVVRQRRDENLERQLCQAASGRSGSQLVVRVSRWLADLRAAWQGRATRRKELKWAHGSTTR